MCSSDGLYGCHGYLETGGDGGILVVSGLCVTNKIIPAGEHLPGKSELSLLPVSTTNICIFSHSDKKKQKGRQTWALSCV